MRRRGTAAPVWLAAIAFVAAVAAPARGTDTPTATPIPTETETPTETSTETETGTATETPTASESATATATSTATVTVSATPTETASATETATITITWTPLAGADEPLAIPNPASPPYVRFYFYVPLAGEVEIRLYDFAGREAARVRESVAASGYTYVRWDLSRLASGMYTFVVSVPDTGGVRRLKPRRLGVVP